MLLRSLRRAAPLALALLGAAGGVSCGDARPGPTKPADTAASSAGVPPAAPPVRVVMDLVSALPNCDLDHRGLLFDTGTAATAGRFGWSGGVPPGITSVEHDGSTWARFTDRKFSFTFFLPAATQIFVSARAVSYGAKSLAVALDEQPLGTLSLARDQIRIATTGTTTLPVDAGLHTLSFRFYGPARENSAFADLDWIRVGFPDESAVTYGPPTLRDVVAPAAAIGGVPHRSLALRAPGSVRCALRVPRGARLRAALGLQGAGEGEAEIRVLRDGKKLEVLRAVHLEAGDKPPVWTDLDVSLDPFAGQVIALDLHVEKAPRGGRVLFGDPAVVLPGTGLPPPVPARAVVIVVLDGVERAELPPWNSAPTQHLAALSELAQTSATFDRHRAPTSTVSAAVASLLTGLPPPSHGLTDWAARLPGGQTTIATVARDASVRAAMFTGVPFTFRAFGLASGWERFVEHSPVSGDPASAPLDAAAAWLTEISRSAADARMLAVVHARGGHPPWDVTQKELSNAPPPDYTGLVEPRRAAQILARLRRSKRANAVSEADRQRIRALEQIALAGQDRALGALVAALRTANLWDSTLLVVTGDVGSGASDLFADGTDLKEPALALPLYVHFPGGLHAGKRLQDPTELVDVTRSAMVALGLAFSKPTLGRDLARLAADVEDGPSSPQIATLDIRYSARWGDLVLAGRYGAPPFLCDLSVDPLCAFNRREASPLAAQAIFRSVVAAEPRPGAAPRREPATLDPDTASALKVWGVMMD